MDDIHFKHFIIESGGQFGEKAQQVLKEICKLVITQSTTGQCGSNISYLLLEIKTPGDPRSNNFFNAQKWFKAHKKSQDPDSLLTLDLIDGLL